MKIIRDRGLAKRILLVTLATLLVLSAIGIVAYAEFTKSSRAKRVVASYEASAALFSSNYLLRHSGTANEAANRKAVYMSTSESPAVSHVTICNYAQGSPAKVCETDIKYMLHAEIIKITDGIKTVATNADAEDLGSSVATITYKHGDGASEVKQLGVGCGDGGANVFECTFAPQVLTGSTSDMHNCTVEMSSDFLAAEGTHFFLYLSAVPVAINTPDNTTDLSSVVVNNTLPTLDCSFYASLSTETRPVTWTGKFNEPGALTVPTSAPYPNVYDGFRYVIEGNGTGTFRLYWNNDYLTPSKLFLLSRVGARNETSGTINIQGVLKTDLYTATDDTTTLDVVTVNDENDDPTSWRYVEFGVNSDFISRYDLQIYYQPGAAGTFTSWDQLVSEDPSDANSPYIVYEYIAD